MRSLYYRVLLITLLAVIISSLLGFLVSNMYYHLTLKKVNDAKLIEIAETIRDYAKRYPDDIVSYLTNAAALGYELYLVDEHDHGVFFGRPFREKDLSREAETLVLSGQRYHGVAEFPSQPFVTGYFDNRMSNTVGVPLQIGAERYALFLRPDIRLQFGELRSFFAMIFVLTVLFSMPFFLISTRYLVQPITRLTEATKRIAEGQYHIHIATGRKDEIGQLASHFQLMSRELERAEKARQEFVANVSHEIQSPLASIQGFAETLLGEDVNDELRQYYAGIIGAETRHLSALSKQLLLLSTLDHNESVLVRKPYSLKRQLRQVLQLMEWQLAEKELAVRLVVPEHDQIKGDEVLLLQVWTNLLSNAVKHVPAGRSIEILASCGEKDCEVIVTDMGDGIPDEQLPFIYDRFYRGDQARQRATGSTGLGLSIVQKIVHLHGGTIEVTSEVGKGTSFHVSIPQ